MAKIVKGLAKIEDILCIEKECSCLCFCSRCNNMTNCFAFDEDCTVEGDVGVGWDMW